MWFRIHIVEILTHLRLVIFLVNIKGIVDEAPDINLFMFVDDTTYIIKQRNLRLLKMNI